MSTVKRFAVYDYEATGLSAATDQVIQVAGLGVDKDLNYIKGDEIVLDIKLRPDVVPNPYAFGIHGMSILNLIENGMTEFDAAGHIKNWFKQTRNTCIAGFNNRGYDDEVSRNIFFRTMLDCYDHEWANGNLRADVLQAAMLTYALRPEVLNWPRKPDGSVSMKLADLSAANGIELEHAHDARFDIRATIDLMRKIKSGNEKLWSYFLTLSDKRVVAEKLYARTPLVIVDRKIPRELGNLSLMLPVVEDASQNGKMHYVDLRQDPTELLSLSVEELRRRIFTPMAELPEGEFINSVRSVASNKAPLIADPAVLKGRGDLVERAGLDLEECQKHAEMIAGNHEFRGRLQQAMQADYPVSADIYQTIYSGFIGKTEATLRGRLRIPVAVDLADKPAVPAIVKTDPFELCKQLPDDRVRVFELALRAKWANFTDEVLALKSYTLPELQEWISHLERTWFDKPSGKNQINIESYKLTMEEYRAKFVPDERQEKALIELEAHIESTLDHILALKGLAAQMEQDLQNSPSSPAVAEEHTASPARPKVEEASGLEP